jgi:hypothetical protein
LGLEQCSLYSAIDNEFKAIYMVLEVKKLWTLAPAAAISVLGAGVTRQR